MISPAELSRIWIIFGRMCIHRAEQISWNRGRIRLMAERRSVIVGTGSCLPDREMTNTELALSVDTSDEWIVERTGIRSRRIAGEGETTSTLAAVAARRALEAAGVAASEIGQIIVAKIGRESRREK